MLRMTIIACVLAACWRGGDRDQPPPAEPSSPPPRVAAVAKRCNDPSVVELVSYLDVKLPSTYWVEMVPGGTTWVPAKHIPMPHHHATALVLENLDAFAAQLAGATRARFVVEITSRDIQAVPNRREWRTSYFARIVDACPLAP
jgi:hypothetical protein